MEEWCLPLILICFFTPFLIYLYNLHKIYSYCTFFYQQYLMYMILCGQNKEIVVLIETIYNEH